MGEGGGKDLGFIAAEENAGARESRRGLHRWPDERAGEAGSWARDLTSVEAHGNYGN